MRTSVLSLGPASVLLAAILAFSGCKSSEDGSAYVSGGLYYGVGWADPWFYGPEAYPPAVIVTPPPERPEAGPHPEHPIAKPPPSTPKPTPRPMPSIPSRPRPAPRR